jgi:acyl-CoA reductase-like NAD-dependent aldehyde dehydrogenase
VEVVSRAEIPVSVSNSSAAAAFVESVNPATGEGFARFESSPAGEVQDCVARARRAQSGWAGRSLRQRAACIRKLRDVIYARRDELASLVTRESGKPIVESLFADVLTCVDSAAYLAANLQKFLAPENVPHHSPAAKLKRGWLQFEPYGVIGIVSPWNYPLAIPLVECIYAVAAGNAAVLKPSELTPSCGKAIGELFVEAGAPQDLLQVIYGAGDVGTALIGAKPDKLIFTGSVAAGRKVAAACGERLIPTILELGGKDAMLVLRDADLDTASSAAVWGAFMNCGQTCISVERLYVERTIAQEFTRLCVEKTKKVKIGRGDDPDVEIGPLIRSRDVDRVESQVREAVAAGAQVLTGGDRRPDLGPNFFEPTVITGVTPQMRIMREETFGPVLAVQQVESAEEAVAFANDSPFALAASVWTRDAKRGREIASQLHAGAVMINDVTSYFGIAEAPHGGRADSGWGRTHSRVGLLELVQVKYVDVDGMPRTAKPWWFGYDAALSNAGGKFLQFSFAPNWLQRIASAPGLRRLLFRKHRI